MAKAEKRGRGRPPSTNPKDTVVRVRIDAPLAADLEGYRERNNLDDLSAAIRHGLRRAIKLDDKK